MERESVEKIKWLADSMLNNFPGCIMRVVYTEKEMWMDYVSDGVERIFGVTPEEYRNKINDAVVGKEPAAAEIWGKEFVEEAIRTGRGLRREYSITNKSGDLHWIEVRSSIISWEEGKLTMQYVVLDIDEQKRAEELAKREHERLEVVAGLSADSVFEYDIAADRMHYYNHKEGLLNSLYNQPILEHYTARILDGSILKTLF